MKQSTALIESNSNDLLMLCATAILVMIFPILLFSWYSVKRKKYYLHRAIQITLTSLFVIYVILYEITQAKNGGIFRMVEDSSYYGSTLLNGIIFVHSALYISTLFLWVVLIIYSVKRIGKNADNFRFSPIHRLAARIGVVILPMTSVSGILLYYYGFLQ